MNSSVIEKCVGRKVDLIYVDTSGRFTMRRVALFSIRNGKARVYDVRKRGFRTLVVNRILAVQAADQTPAGGPETKAARWSANG